MKLLDPDHPMFRKAWVRWATVLVPTLWGGVEIAWASPGWGIVFLAAGGYAAWVLLLRRGG
jgi:hypothetical protein